MSPEVREASADQVAFLSELLEGGLLLESGVPGVYGHSDSFEDVREALAARLSAEADRRGTERLRFSPVLPRRPRVQRLPVVVPASGGQHLRLRGRRATGGTRRGARGLERVPGADRPHDDAGRLLSGVPGDCPPWAPAGGWRVRRRGWRLGVPSRALARSDAPPDLPPARAGADRRARRRPRVARRVGGSRPGDSPRARSRCGTRRRQRPLLRPSRADARAQPAGRPSDSSWSCSYRSPAPSRRPARPSITTATTSARDMGSSSPTVRPPTPPAWASGTSGSCSARGLPVPGRARAVGEGSFPGCRLGPARRGRAAEAGARCARAGARTARGVDDRRGPQRDRDPHRQRPARSVRGDAAGHGLP